MKVKRAKFNLSDSDMQSVQELVYNFYTLITQPESPQAEVLLQLSKETLKCSQPAQEFLMYHGILFFATEIARMARTTNVEEWVKNE